MSPGERGENFSNSNSNSIHTIHTLHTLLKQGNREELHSFLNKIEEERGVQHSFYCSDPLWKLFMYVLRLADPLSSASEEFRRFMVSSIVAYYEKAQAPQVSLQQFFINRPAQVNIAEKQVVNPPKERIDYSGLSPDELKDLFRKARKIRDTPTLMSLAFEIKRRTGSECRDPEELERIVTRYAGNGK